MLGGNISNQPAPVVVIDIDKLIIEKPEKSISKFGSIISRMVSNAEIEVEQYKVNTDIYPLLENIYYNYDAAIYFFAHRPHFYREPLERKLDELLYNRLYIGGIKEREALLKRRNVIAYYYATPEHGSILSKSKEHYIEHWNEISL
jgi:hypothetical protein